MIGRQKLIPIILILVVIVGVLAWVFGLGAGVGGVKQPIEFPHKKHVAQGLPCSTCHQRVETDVVAGRPPSAVCMGCHGAMESQNPEIKKVKAYGEKKQEIPWQRVWRLPSHVFFTHRVHVTVAKVECQTCHGPMASLDRPPPRPLKTLTMDDCIDCHKKSQSRAKSNEAKENVAHQESSGAPDWANNCIVCHR